MDIFQQRYLKYQKRKTKVIEKQHKSTKVFYNLLAQTNVKEALMNRKSRRVFNDNPLNVNDVKTILKSVTFAPSSCNRKAIYLKKVSPKQITPFLVGAAHWGYKANKCYLMFASKIAYKSPNEKDFMPYLDCGFAAQNMYLMSEILNIGCCFVNPNICEENKKEFNEKYNKNDDYFCGAMFLGNYDEKRKIYD